MAEHFSQKIRKILDAPSAKKGYLFWLFSPFLACVSFCWFAASYFRRLKGYRNLKTIQNALGSIDKTILGEERLKIVCFGNILVGGTGKTPIVRAYAEKHLENGIIAIASRGIYAHPVCIDSQNISMSDLTQLSDENREHFELLKLKYSAKKFFIYQNPNRFASLLDFANKISSFPENTKSLFILDDGLQHFSCPRHINICVCDSQVDGVALPFSLPLGPYREGFGKRSLESILASFDLCLLPQHLGQSQKKFPYRNIHHQSVPYKLKIVQCVYQSAETFVLNELLSGQMSFDIHGTLLIAGISHPERFLNSFTQKYPNFRNVSTVFLADHEKFSADILKHMQSYSVIILTLKDFFRFCSNESFIQCAQSRTVYGCYLEYDVSSLNV